MRIVQTASEMAPLQRVAQLFKNDGDLTESTHHRLRIESGGPTSSDIGRPLT